MMYMPRLSQPSFLLTPPSHSIHSTRNTCPLGRHRGKNSAVRPLSPEHFVPHLWHRGAECRVYSILHSLRRQLRLLIPILEPTIPVQRLQSLFSRVDLHLGLPTPLLAVGECSTLGGMAFLVSPYLPGHARTSGWLTANLANLNPLDRRFHLG